ncbi:MULTISPECIES: aldehyde dehydrogenase family protein [Prochlorococcus]|uniref:aldehyde dehydrogenase family protein n=1 Tax=Prochlorococcus TaxID=1218 RepID=UPI00056D0440|nr:MULTISPECIES: aldehyde dehydrogenase family protein [Prochlorococcus]
MNTEDFNINNLRKPVLNGETRSINWRKLQLGILKALVEENEDAILEALACDLGKPPTEAFFEIAALKQELSLTSKNLSSWIKAKSVNVPIFLKPGNAMSLNEPLGCVLIIGPWNYPFMLTIHPLISALAAGNTAVVKPSEYAPETSKLIAKLINLYFPKDVVLAFEGDSKFSEQLVKNKFDHIFFTGGSKIGSKIMQSAAKTLTPVTLELGGKNPAIIIKGADIETTARRLIWGKSINAGQTCLAPNHILVEEGLKEGLIKQMKDSIINFYGSEPLESSSLGNLNNRHFERINNLLENARDRNQIIFGGDVDLKRRRVSPTLIDIKSFKDSLLEEDEIFGPLLPIVEIKNLSYALDQIRKYEKPLAIYMFGGSKEDQKILINTTSSGGVCFNDVIIQAGIPELPFGGVGYSGMGSYHGKAGFDNFSHKKSILNRPFWLDLQFRYPPYNIDISLLRKLLS